jgi:hypothetical protein
MFGGGAYINASATIAPSHWDRKISYSDYDVSYRARSYLGDISYGIKAE